MSRVVEETRRENGFRTIVEGHDGKGYCVDTALTYDCGWETMVFPYSLRGHRVTRYDDLICRHYKTAREAIEGHGRVVEDLLDADHTSTNGKDEKIILQ
jgi:hypothetical protein